VEAGPSDSVKKQTESMLYWLVSQTPSVVRHWRLFGNGERRYAVENCTNNVIGEIIPISKI
jgi:hypothetical protein